METNVCYQGDCLEVMKGIPDDSIDLIVTSPPYNKTYWSKNRNINNGARTKSRRIEYDSFVDSIEPKKYEEQQVQFLQECIRVIKDTGSIFYNHIDIFSEHQTIHPKYVYDFPVKQIIIWNRKNAKFNKSIWDFNPERNNDFPAPFPIDLPDNCIKACCPINGIVLDPYMGSGTTALACKNNNVNFIGIEISEEYCKIASERTGVDIIK